LSKRPTAKSGGAATDPPRVRRGFGPAGISGGWLSRKIGLDYASAEVALA